MHLLRDALPAPDHRAPLTFARVIGIGSPAGDDRLGWWLVEALRARLAADGAWLAAGDARQVDVLALDRPGAALVNHLAGAERVILVDALLDGGCPGEVLELDLSQLLGDGPALSSHALGVAGALRLAAALGALPPRLHVLGVSVPAPAAVDMASSGPTAPVRHALPELLDRVEALLR